MATTVERTRDGWATVMVDGKPIGRVDAFWQVSKKARGVFVKRWACFGTVAMDFRSVGFRTKRAAVAELVAYHAANEF